MNFWKRVDLSLFPHDFTAVNGQAQYCLTPTRNTIYRILILLLTIADFAYVSYFFHPKDTLYFTTWGLILTILCNLVLCVENIIHRYIKNKTNLKYWKVSHFIFTLTLVFEMFITGVYWGALYPYAIINLWGHQGVFDIVNPIMAHAVPIALLTVDLQFNLIVVWNSAYIIVYYLFLGIYLLVNLIYTLKLGPIYDIIDYKSWMSYLFLAGCGVAIVICHILARLYCKHFKQQKVVRLLSTQEQISLTKSQVMHKELLEDTTRETEMTTMPPEHQIQ